jgi:hypothetical protein
MSSRPEKPTPEVDPQTGMVEETGPGIDDRRHLLLLVIMFGVAALGYWIAIKLGLFQFAKWFESLFVGTWLEYFGFLISLPIMAFLFLVLMVVGGAVAEVVFMLFLNKKRFGAPGGLYDPRVLARMQCLYCGYPRQNNDSKCCSECGKPYEPNDQQPDS